ncbi:hypothetical protein SLS56_002229 [Neofusicoccum ribis]|uniref:Uncharacterized protein n=1 Tax=Neofusicoccum ribis TaxID=45134 RepID=A0ABR3T4M5_9PEZI
MSKPGISTQNPYLPSYFDPEAYSTVQPGTHPDAFNRLHNEPKREEDKGSNLALPRYGIFLLVFVPVMIFCLAVTIYYLNRNRRNGMKRATSPIELESQQAGHRYPTPTPSLPELYWPNAFDPSSSPTTASDAGDSRHHRGRPQRSPQPPRRPRSRSSNLDKSLPALPRGEAGEDRDEWETVRDNDTFADAFAQHRRDRDREADRRRRRSQRGVNDAFAAHRRRLQDQLDFADTDVIASSDTYTMGPPSSSAAFGYLSQPPPPPPPRRNPNREIRNDDGYVPARDLLGGARRFVAEPPPPPAPPSSSGLFPSSLDEMSMWPETELTDDPYKEAVARNRREGR